MTEAEEDLEVDYEEIDNEDDIQPEGATIVDGNEDVDFPTGACVGGGSIEDGEVDRSSRLAAEFEVSEHVVECMLEQRVDLNKTSARWMTLAVRYNMLRQPREQFHDWKGRLSDEAQKRGEEHPNIGRARRTCQEAAPSHRCV